MDGPAQSAAHSLKVPSGLSPLLKSRRRSERTLPGHLGNYGADSERYAARSQDAARSGVEPREAGEPGEELPPELEGPELEEESSHESSPFGSLVMVS